MWAGQSNFPGRFAGQSDPTDPLEPVPVNVIHYSFHILQPRPVHLLKSLRFYVFHTVCRNKPI